MIGIDIPLPTDCLDCPLQYDGTCPPYNAAHPEAFYEQTDEHDLTPWAYSRCGKPDWCPLIDLNKGGTHS